MITLEQKEVWTVALRSGNFVQGFGQLKREFADYIPNEYCCLGVLEEVCGVSRKSSSFLEHSILPGIVQLRLSHMNDGSDVKLRLNFNTIADFIDTNFESWKLIND